MAQIKHKNMRSSVQIVQAVSKKRPSYCNLLLAGAGVGGAVGGVTGALIGFGIPEYEAKRYEGFVKNGGILLSVHSDTSEEVDKAKKCLESTGAENISSTSETKSDWATPSASAFQSSDAISASSQARMTNSQSFKNPTGVY